ncbi:MAG: ribose transport system permease protein, partial [Pseudonocardiales bacterium]|nr:ribose transport system permease protein [Pseudonocardiales bacterium]
MDRLPIAPATPEPVVSSDSGPVSVPRTGASSTITSVIAKYGVVIAALLLIVVFSILLPSTFATLGNARTIVNSSAIVLVLALAATLPLRAGGFDLSIAGTMVVSAGLVAVMSSKGVPWPVVLVAVLVVGAVVGAANSALIVGLGL